MRVRVLIADPEEYLLDLWRNYLERHDYEVHTAVNGLECVSKLRECGADVLVLEPAIPWGGGDGVLARMNEEPDIPRVPVIVLTYGRDQGVLYRLAPFRVRDYQRKPMPLRRLEECIRNVASSNSAVTTQTQEGCLLLGDAAAGWERSHRREA